MIFIDCFDELVTMICVDYSDALVTMIFIYYFDALMINDVYLLFLCINYE